MLQAQQLTKSYGTGSRRQTVFVDLDLSVAAGEVAALLGASGSGKTSLLNLISGMDSPDAGHVLIIGVDVHTQPEPARTLFRRHHIGFVFQFFNLIPTLTVAENIRLPLELAGIGGEVAEARVDSLLERVGLAGMGPRYPETLSGGEQQRTAVARALAHQPKILLADEPTGNLDEVTGARVMDLLGELARDQGATLLIVTHSRAVADVADRVLELHQGRLIA